MHGDTIWGIQEDYEHEVVEYEITCEFVPATHVCFEASGKHKTVEVAKWMQGKTNPASLSTHILRLRRGRDIGEGKRN